MTLRRCARFILFAACAFLLGAPTANSQTPGTARTVPPGPATAAVSRGNPPICGGERLCTEVNDFAVSMVEFRASLAAPRKILTATLRLENNTNRPVILAYIPRSGIATDERGNRYSAVDTDVRGIGLVGRTVDAKFILQPGQRSDARLTCRTAATAQRHADRSRARSQCPLDDLSAGGAVGTAAPAPGSIADKLRGILGGSQK